jgi:hypothetical protein
MAGKNLESHQAEDPAQAFPLCLASEEMMSEAKQAEKSREFHSAVADLPVRFALAVSSPDLDIAHFFAVFSVFFCTYPGLFQASHIFTEPPDSETLSERTELDNLGFCHTRHCAKPSISDDAFAIHENAAKENFFSGQDSPQNHKSFSETNNTVALRFWRQNFSASPRLIPSTDGLKPVLG